jgi:hypothetical protein
MTRLRRLAVLVVCSLFVGSLTNLPQAGAQTGAPASNRVQKYTEIESGKDLKVGSISADGGAVLATMGEATFVWSQAGGKVPMEYKGQPLFLEGISADGSVAVGFTFNSVHHKKSLDSEMIHFLRWTREKGTEEIFSADTSSWVSMSRPFMKVSSDGRTVVAGVDDAVDEPHQRMMRWVEGQGVKSEVMPQGSQRIVPITMSTDGTVVWGSYSDQSDGKHVFRWTGPEGAKEISDNFYPYSVSADGKVAYGRGMSDGRVYRWTTEKKRELILDLGAIYPKETLAASFVLNDGMTVMGYVYEKAEDERIYFHLFQWTKAKGLQKLAFPEEKRVDGGFAASSDGQVVSAVFIGQDGTEHLAVTPVSDLLAMVAAKERKAEETQAEADQKEADLQAQAEKAMQGHPAQMYSFALRMEKEKRFDIAEKVYAALIDNYPDDPYTAKAIDRQEQAIEEEKAEKKAQQEALAQQAQDQQNAAAHEVAANSCRSQCESQYNSCASDVQAQSNKTTANFLVGMMTKNSSMTQQSVNDASNASSLGDCTSAQNSCISACQ